VHIESLQQFVRQRRYQIKLHTIQHALQEGFGENDIFQAKESGLTLLFAENKKENGQYTSPKITFLLSSSHTYAMGGNRIYLCPRWG
jgi:hypothetical protein